MTTNTSTPTRPRRATVGGSARKQTAARTSQAPRPRRSRATTAPGKPQAGPSATDRREWNYPVAHGLLAAERAVHRTGTQIRLPVVGVLHLPGKKDLVFVGAVTGLATLGILEWPVAIVLGIGHTLAANGHNKLIQEFGEALQEA